MNKQETYDKMVSYGEREFFADQTVKQLKRNILIPMSWGAAKFTGFPSKEYPAESIGLAFSVNGRKFKGLVLITMAWDDTYKVRFFETNSDSSKTERLDLEKSNVYCDELVHRIDVVVESDDNKVTSW